MRAEDEWLCGWDPTPGIVSVWAEANGRAVVWRRIAETGELIREEAQFRPWVLLDRLDDVRHLEGLVTWRELEGPGTLRYLVSAADGKNETRPLPFSRGSRFVTRGAARPIAIIQAEDSVTVGHAATQPV